MLTQRAVVIGMQLIIFAVLLWPALQVASEGYGILDQAANMLKLKP